MDVRCEVDVALSRPPTAHATVFVDVSVDVPVVPSLRDLDHAEAYAKDLACCVAMATRANVVMPVGVRIVDVVL